MESYDLAFAGFDAHNGKDPHLETWQGKEYPKELLYAIRMSERLEAFAPGSSEYIKLAARCQHIGRWEIPRSSYPMDRKGYLQWRNSLKSHHATIAEGILAKSGYGKEIIDKVKFLLLKKELNRNADTQLLEDIICLVFIDFYLDEFARKHDDEKVVDILRKTMKKMTERAIVEVSRISLTPKIQALIKKAGES
ncbi:MAG TPA: DUF4202 domain-containing protein [Chryseolinea sp.]|nr:DUF4202 domain-containing protein [Chryseolinea sp.]